MLKALFATLVLWFCCYQFSLAQDLELIIYSDNSAFSEVHIPQTANLSLAARSNLTVPDGAWQFFVFAQNGSGGTTYGAYDLAEASFSCPVSNEAFHFTQTTVTPTLTHLDIPEAGGAYYVFTCPYTGSGAAANASFGFNNYNFFQLTNVINPQRNPLAQASQIITVPAAIRQLNNQGQPVAFQLESIRLVRNVQMLVTVSPQVSFTLEGVEAGIDLCQTTNQRETTGNLASFGFVDEDEFFDIAQKISVSTNCADGYIVTAIQDDQMHLPETNFCSGHGDYFDDCLPNATVANMSHTQTQAWTSRKQGRGLAFTLQNIVGNDAVFDYTQGYRHFADRENGEEPQIIMRQPNSDDGQDYLCYRLVAKDTNLNGIYTNHLTYTVTVPF